MTKRVAADSWGRLYATTVSRSRSFLYVRLAIARPLRGLFTYAVPSHLGKIEVGHVVLAPFGRRGAETGYVIEHVDEPEFDPAKIKPIQRLLDPEPAFGHDQLKFFKWIADYYLAPLGLVIQTALPSTIRARSVQVLEPTDEGAQALAQHAIAGEEAQVLREVIARPGLTRKGMARRLERELDKDNTAKAVDRLVRAGLVAWGTRELGEAKGRVATATLTMAMDGAMALVPTRAHRMREVVAALGVSDGPVDVRALVESQGSGARPALKRLVELGAVEMGEREARDALLDAPALGARVAPTLNADQTAALSALTAPDAKGTFLLWGVTGSGKTEVFLGAAKAAIEQGKQVLVLVPEIGLTPQLVGRFRARFGEDFAVLHSGLTGGERLTQWRRIRAREAPIAVGARSALFAPFTNLGLIVVDEEHDDSYKQDDGVTYSARDLAVVLGRFHACPVVLASATPSLESWHNVTLERYELLHLPKRATPSPVPSIELIDLTELEPVDGKRPLFAPEAISALKETFDAGGKAIVLYNRRGYATMVQCTSCGGTFECPSCGIAMTLHRNTRVVTCHYCSYKVPYTQDCPACGKPDLDELGKGTERVEESLNAYFPDIPIGRMDADTTSVRGAHGRILDDFRKGTYRMLVGTQIVAKGHDFPDVHTAIVVSADQAFRLPDFRAAERTYALLVQLAGRAGRGQVPGRVIVQTWNPKHYALHDLDDLHAFYAEELRIRQMLRHPPFSRLTLIRLDGVDRKKVQQRAYDLSRTLRSTRAPQDGNEVLGPSPAALAKLVGRWRFQILLRGNDMRAYRSWLGRSFTALTEASSGGVRVGWDVDPRHVM